MNNDELEPLALDLQSLLADEKAAPGLSGAATMRIQERIANSIAGNLMPPSDAGAGAAASATGAEATGTLAALAAKPVLIAAAAFGIGVGTGVGGTLVLGGGAAPKREAPENMIVEPGQDAGLPPRPDANAPEEPADAAPPEAKPDKVDKPRPPKDPDTRDRKLAEERALIERARAAIRQRDAKTALRHLKEHTSSHPKGRLAEERDALRIQALVLDHSYTKAKAETNAFRERYPQSVFLPVVNQAMSELP